MGDADAKDTSIIGGALQNNLFTQYRTDAVAQNHINHEELARDQEIDHTPTIDEFGDVDAFLTDLFDGDSADEDIVVPSLKRKRGTNYSPVLDLELDPTEDIAIPAPKRNQYVPVDKDQSVFIGVWKDSPFTDPATKHAVYAFIDNGDRIRSKIYLETRNGAPLCGGIRSGTGRTFVPPSQIILEPHLASLSAKEVKEYVRIMYHEQGQHEVGDKRKEAEEKAVTRAQTVVSTVRPTITTSPTTHSIPSPPAKRPISNSSMPVISGVLLGYWKHSDAILDADKHAMYAVVDEATERKRMRLKIVKYTRDGRSHVGNFPINNGFWVSYEQLVLEPALAHLNRLEVTEYASIRQKEIKNGVASVSSFQVDGNAILKAIRVVAKEAKALGIDPIKRAADLEAKRQYHSDLQAAEKAKENGVSLKVVKPGTQRSGVVISKIEAHDVLAGAMESDTRVNKRPNASRTNGSPGTGPHEARPAKTNDPQLARAKVRDSVSGPLTNATSGSKFKTPEANRTPSAENAQGKATAIRSSKADSDARAEKLRRLREATAKKEALKSKDDGVERDTEKNSQPPSEGWEMGVGTAKKRGEAARQGDGSGAIPADKNFAKKREEMKKTSSASTQAKAANGIPEARDQSQPEKIPNMPRSPSGVKWYNGVKYERKDSGPLAGKLVASKREVLTIDGEDYVEYRILMRTEF